MVQIFLLILMFFSDAAFAEQSLVALEKPTLSRDLKSIERGAKFFATNCMVCHTLIYLRYDPIAKKAGILYEKMPINIKNWPNGIKPPDLSLEADLRGADWIYTYLHSFYVDPKTVTGANNLVFPNSAMPYILSAFQGTQMRIPSNRVANPIYSWEHQWYDLLELKAQGSMTPEQFDATIEDLVNFLVYASKPYQSTQVKLGWWVIAFLILLLILTYLLKREYWKDVEH